MLVFKGRAATQAVIRWPLTVDIHLRYQANSCEICGRQIATGAGFSLSTSVLLRSLSFYKCAIFVFILMLPLSEGQADRSFGTFKKSNAFYGH